MFPISPTDIYELSNYVNLAYDSVASQEPAILALQVIALCTVPCGIKGLTGLIKDGLKKTPLKISDLENKI